MATTLKTKNSVTAASAPSSLAQGELAVNITDKKLWVGNAATTPVQIAGNGFSPSYGALTATSITDSGLTTGRVTYATTGSAADFGDLTLARGTLSACSSPTRGVWAGGDASGSAQNATIDYITISSTGNATSFGSLSTGTTELAGCSSSTRGLFGGGYTSSRTTAITYITIASTGNSTSFGSLTLGRNALAALSSSTRAVFAGGDPGNAPYTTNVIDYVTIASTGNATDFGDLTVARDQVVGCSNVSGGTQ